MSHDFADLWADLVDAQVRLREAVRDACPGDHRPVQHRDRRPAWCECCGRDQYGVRQHERADQIERGEQP